jgi:SAM-dependent methyltransferase
MVEQEKYGAIARCLRLAQLAPVWDRKVLAVGCGNGADLLRLLSLGFTPENLTGVELLPERAAAAAYRLPKAVCVIEGDALTADLPLESFDVVLQSTVFTSILDDDFQEKLADRMWSLTKPGGGVLWYDFIYDNPSNPDVRGVPIRRIRRLFPNGKLKYWRLTLAPPIGRPLTRISPKLYTLLNCLPFLRTHVLCWITKPPSSG